MIILYRILCSCISFFLSLATQLSLVEEKDWGGGEEEEALFKSCHVALIHLLSLEGARDSSDGQELHSTHDTRTVWGIENCFLRKPSQLRT